MERRCKSHNTLDEKFLRRLWMFLTGLLPKCCRGTLMEHMEMITIILFIVSDCVYIDVAALCPPPNLCIHR